MTTIPGPTPDTGHQCPLDYPYYFTDELYWRDTTPTDPDEWPELPGRSVAIDHPRHEEGRLWQCPDPDCGTWWEYTRGEIPPTPRHLGNGYIRCTTTYRPSWRRVSPWSPWDWSTRRRIREHGGQI